MQFVRLTCVIRPTASVAASIANGKSNKSFERIFDGLDVLLKIEIEGIDRTIGYNKESLVNTKNILLRYEVPQSVSARLIKRHKYAWVAYLCLCLPLFAFGAYKTFAIGESNPDGLNRLWVWSMLIPIAMITPLIKRTIQGGPTRELSNEITARLSQDEVFQKSLYKILMRTPWSEWQLGINMIYLSGINNPIKTSSGNSLFLDVGRKLTELVIYEK